MYLNVIFQKIFQIQIFLPLKPQETGLSEIQVLNLYPCFSQYYNHVQRNL